MYLHGFVPSCRRPFAEGRISVGDHSYPPDFASANFSVPWTTGKADFAGQLNFFTASLEKGARGDMIQEAQKKAGKERRFECQKCGYCCSQRAFLYPSREDIKKLSAHLNLSECAFALRYLREVYDPQAKAYVMAFQTNNPGDSGPGCIFCQDNLCVIHDSPRTDLCHVFPWNHFDLEREEWEEGFFSADDTFWCPGIGQGRLWSLEEIRNVKKAFPNVGAQIQRHYNFPPPLGSPNLDAPRPSKFSLSMSEERLINKLRFLTMEKNREVEDLVDDLYHGGHSFYHRSS